MKISKNTWVLVIDTDQYAGNFERALFSHLEQYPNLQAVLSKFLLSNEDEPSCGWEFHVWSTPGWFNHGMGEVFREGPGKDKEARRAFRNACREYMEKTLSMVHPLDQERFQKEWAQRAKKPLTKHPAFLSVGIPLTNGLTNEELLAVMDLAEPWLTEKGVHFTGVRLLPPEEAAKQIQTFP